MSNQSRKEQKSPLFVFFCVNTQKIKNDYFCNTTYNTNRCTLKNETYSYRRNTSLCHCIRTYTSIVIAFCVLTQKKKHKCVVIKRTYALHLSLLLHRSTVTTKHSNTPQCRQHDHLQYQNIRISDAATSFLNFLTLFRSAKTQTREHSNRKTFRPITVTDDVTTVELQVRFFPLSIGWEQRKRHSRGQPAVLETAPKCEHHRVRPAPSSRGTLLRRRRRTG